MIDFYDLLQINNLDVTAKVKMVRHQEPKYNLADFRSQGIFDLYQSIQGRPVFDNCEYLASFIGQKGSRALFCGVYKVNGRKSGKEIELPKSPAPEAESAILTEQYHTVEAKETLYAISKKYGVTVEDIQKWNNLADTGIQIGQRLIVGYK